MNIPNLLTLLRIALIPVFVVSFYLPFKWSNEAATVVFFLAGVTDWLDGYLARRMQQVSPLGAFLDPVADKLM
ncbi:MAG: CDP-alcohol phosphatidyltransferase family protein, partial [Gammaproteobacteria bacterium]|nr:CDP-alcohol phosphatidyltransferase family protein [Gammaproteobacteria bacterium]